MLSTGQLKRKVNTTKAIVISLLVLLVSVSVVEAQDITRVSGAGVVSDENTGFDQRFGGAATSTQDGWGTGMWSQMLITENGMSHIMCQVSNLKTDVSMGKNLVVIYGHLFEKGPTMDRCNVVFEMDDYWETITYYYVSTGTWPTDYTILTGGTLTEDHLRFTW